MVFKLSHESEIGSLSFVVTGKLYDNLLEFLIVLDNEYGADRDMEHDDSGYVLFCTSGTTDSEIQRYFHFPGLVSEWVIDIPHQPEYCASLHELLNTVYKEIIEKLGINTAMTIYQMFKDQQISFPPLL